jgi:pimeloyl-ACP methyl ester carboxylesterase
MHQNIARSELKVLARGGHYAVWEQPEAAGNLVRQFLDSAQLSSA